jgi:hypothetical protein
MSDQPWQDTKSAPPHVHGMVETESGYRFPDSYNPASSLNEDSEEAAAG